MQFSSSGRVERLQLTSPTRALTYTVVFLEPALEAELFGRDAYAHIVRAGRLRFVGEVEDVPVELAWQPARGRGHYVMLSPALCKQLALGPGSEVTIRFDLVRPDLVTIPDDIRAALARRPAHARRWAALSAGEQRALIAHLASARTDATRARRVADLFAPLARMPRATRPRHRRAAAGPARRATPRR